MLDAEARTDWPFEVKPLHREFGCEISGLTMDQAVSPESFGKVCVLTEFTTRLYRVNARKQ